MARKQSLANKRRSQKRNNKKKARTIRSMRQVNRRGKGLFESLGRLGRLERLGRLGSLGRSDKYPSVREILLDLDDKKEGVFEEPQIVKPVSYVPPEEIGVQPLIVPKLKEEEEDALYDNLKVLLLLHVCIRYPDLVSDDKIYDKVRKFIFNPNNEDLVLDPFIEHINDLLTKNLSTIKDIFQTNTSKTKFINSIDSNISKLKTHVSANVDYLNLVSVILEQLIKQLKEYLYNDVNFSSSFNDSNDSDKKEAAKTIASLTFLDIFKDRMVGFEPAGIIQESEFLRQHVDNIYDDYSVTAGGSKGKKKSKMRRPKSRTRKL